MKNDVHVLLIGGKGGSVAEGLLKCLRLAEYATISLLAYSDQAPHLYRVERKIIAQNTPDSGKLYIDELIHCCRDHKINAVLPGATWEAKIIAEYAALFWEEGIAPLVNNIDTIKIGDNKWETFQFLKSRQLGVPLSFLDKEKALQELGDQFPLIVKPVSGRGSKDVFLANNQKELNIIVDYFEAKGMAYLVQEHISSEEKEYTVGVLSDKKGKVIQSIVMQRKLFGGATGYAKILEHGFINEFCENVARAVRSTGPINVQLRLNEDNLPLVLEINPRFSGSAPMRALGGFNEPDMIIRNFLLGEELSPVPYQAGNQYYRVFQEIEIAKGAQKGAIKMLV